MSRVTLCVAALQLLLVFCKVEAQPTGSYYTTAGGSSSTCGKELCPTSSCGPGQFLRNCTGTSPGTCVPCTNTLNAGSKYDTNGGLTDTCGIVQCTACPAGSRKVTTGLDVCGGGVNKTMDGACESCGPISDTEYWDTNADALSNCPKLSRRTCQAGEQNVGSNSTHPGTCVGCAGLQPNHYWLTPNSSVFGCQQAAHTTCGPGYFSVVATRTATAPGTCLACPALTNNGFFYGTNAGPNSTCDESRRACSDSSCLTGQYVKDCGSEFPFTSNGTCANCTNGGMNSTLVYNTKGGWQNNCGVIGCSADACSLGQYMSGCGGLPSNMQCLPCTNVLTAGVSFYSGKGITPVCPTTNCRACSAGFYTFNCTTLSDGTCTGCTN